jgi:hypothetical protein
VGGASVLTRSSWRSSRANVRWNGLAQVVAPGRMWLGKGVVVLRSLPPLSLTLTRRSAAAALERETNTICRS